MLTHNLQDPILFIKLILSKKINLKKMVNNKNNISNFNCKYYTI